jgi:pyruvate/2-oxoglutarate dehydrogenase complex dihydrolipoamide acyltransferase (E2) component
MITIHTPTVGVLAAWIRRPGDEIAEGDVLAIIEGDDGRYAFVESPHDGILDTLLAQGSVRVTPEAPLARLHVRARELALSAH